MAFPTRALPAAVLAAALAPVATATAAAAAAAAGTPAADPPADVPGLADHFPDAGLPTHAFVLLEGETGKILRTEGPDGTEAPADGAVRLLLAIDGLESGAVDPSRRVACDSTCWANGGHGEPDLMEGLAFGCDRWAADAQARVGAAALRARAVSLGLGDVAPGAGASPHAWAEVWRALTSDRLGLRTATTTAILASAGLAVTSPRGAARTLHDPRRRTRALVFAGTGGCWVLGSRTVLSREWVFALHMPGAVPALAAARAARLVEDTRDVARRSSAERGGRPIPE